MFKRWVVCGIRLCLFRLRDGVFQPGKLNLSFLNPNQCVIAQFVFHILILLEGEHDYASFRDADVLRLSVETQRFFAALTTDAALLHAAERDTEIAD